MKRIPVYMSQNELETVLTWYSSIEKEGRNMSFDDVTAQKLKEELATFEHPEPSNAEEDQERRGFDND